MAQPHASTHRVRPFSVILACLAIAIAMAFLTLRPARRHDRHPPGVAPTADVAIRLADPPPGPATELTPSVDGARAAAIAYLRLSEVVVAMDDAEAAKVQRAAAASSAANRLVAETLAKLAALRRSFPGGPIQLRVAPLAVRAALDGPARARTDIWHVTVVSPPGGAVYEQWRMSRYQLVWERQAWRVSGESTEDGPRPLSPALPPPVSASTLEAALAGFEAAR